MVNLDLGIKGKKLHFPTPHYTPTNKSALAPMIALLKSLAHNINKWLDNFKKSPAKCCYLYTTYLVSLSPGAV